METTLDLLRSTESFLRQADQNLQKIRAIKFEQDVAKKLQPVVEKYAEVDKELQKQKVKILNIFACLANLIDARSYHISFGACFDYVIDSHGKVVVREGDLRGQEPNKRGCYTFEHFVADQDLHFDYFCDLMLGAVKRFLKTAPERQAHAVAQTARLANELVELGKTAA